MSDWTRIDQQRLVYCRQTSPEMSNAELARYYNFSIDFVNQNLGWDNSERSVKRGKRPDWIALGRKYADDNEHQLVTAQQFSDLLNCSLPTAYKTIDALPNSFRKIKRGLWECRNEMKDRRNAH